MHLYNALWYMRGWMGPIYAELTLTLGYGETASKSRCLLTDSSAFMSKFPSSAYIPSAINLSGASTNALQHSTNAASSAPSTTL